jgi:hypothetical protein
MMLHAAGGLTGSMGVSPLLAASSAFVCLVQPLARTRLAMRATACVASRAPSWGWPLRYGRDDS